MEILSPAGNMQHIETAIKNQSDAVYGGLKNWNARHKAMNFSIEEYNEVVKKLHENNIKFYLTLNTLVLDEELEDIMNFLKNPRNELPDAFIVADLGLIKILKREFPNVELHFSTQFGSHNMDDVECIKKLGGSRVILAREMTEQEISNIRDTSEIDVECFVWGSQCISYSGLCFFGSLINGGSGNRGKCIITCRDVYESNEKKGHLLYVPDLDSINKFYEIDGIDCYKLEGRRRPAEEIGKIISQIKNKEKSSLENGFVYGKNVSKSNLFEIINSRIKPMVLKSDLNEINKYDVFMRFENDVPISFVKEEVGENIYYVYSEYLKKYDVNLKNLNFEFKTSGKFVDEILYMNYKGEGKTFFNNRDDRDIIFFNVDEFVSEVESLNSNINVYKVKYKHENLPLTISKTMINEIKKFIFEDCKDKDNKYKSSENLKLERLYVETNEEEVIKKFIDDNSIKIIFNIGSKENLVNIERFVNLFGDRVIYKLPIFNWDSTNLMPYYSLLQDKEVMFTKLSQLFKTDKIAFKKKYVDYTIYIWNKVSLDTLNKFNIDEFSASPELSYERNASIFENENMQFVVGGKLPLVYTRQCFDHIYKCSSCFFNESDKGINNIDKQMDFKVICQTDHRFIIYNKPILNNFTRFEPQENISYRYVTYGQTVNEIEKSIKLFKSDDYYNQLKNTDTWKDSYECNVLEGRN